MMVEAILGLGSNVGDREENIRRALSLIGEFATVGAVSSIYETEPMYLEGQNWFFNCVVAVDTELQPAVLLGRLMEIEREMGRVRGERYGPRVIDIDVLFYGDLIISEPGLEIPHPKVAERPFVLVPLGEIRPDFVHPVAKVKVTALRDALRDGKRVVKRKSVIG
jgi:2-amino-4-hydroxy-6-hydroxymethyldihydropteridine diphosphokinase